jgi:hypothetical protein
MLSALPVIPFRIYILVISDHSIIKTLLHMYKRNKWNVLNRCNGVVFETKSPCVFEVTTFALYKRYTGFSKNAKRSEIALFVKGSQVGRLWWVLNVVAEQKWKFLLAKAGLVARKRKCRRNQYSSLLFCMRHHLPHPKIG